MLVHPRPNAGFDMAQIIDLRARHHARASSESSRTRKSSAVTAPSVTRAMRSATSREGQAPPSQSCVIRPPLTPMDCAKSPRLMLLSDRYSESFMEKAFSSAKSLAQVKLLVPLHGQEKLVHRQFSMGKKSAQRKFVVPPKAPEEPLQRTFIKAWRKHRKMSQGDLGYAVGLSTASISQIENAETGYSQRHLEDIANVIGVHPIDLLVCDPNKHPEGIWPFVASALGKLKI